MCMYSELPGYPVVRTGHFHCCGLDSVSGQELRSCKAQDMTPPPKKKKTKKQVYISFIPFGYLSQVIITVEPINNE